jgi:sugar phosphate isomerase/epimerase
MIFQQSIIKRIGAGTIALALAAFTFVPAAVRADSLDPSQIGLQLYSLRAQFQTDPMGTFDKLKAFGIHNVELAGTYQLSPEAFKKQLDAHGLVAVSGHFPYERMRDDPEGVARDANVLGLKYAGCAWIPHGDKFDEKTCREAIAVFNHAGEVFAKHGLKFFYHSHGYEFQPFQDGTLFDLLMTETKPEYVNYEMDVFWIVHAGQDPVKLLQKYDGRWLMLHLKGMRDSTPTGLLTGHSDVTNDVAVGQGKIDYVPVLQEAKKIGVKYYIIEDESPTSEKQIPQSFNYLNTVKW